MTYKEQLANPRWQRKRLQIFERDRFTCQICLDTETQLQVHHKSYDNTYQTKAWEYPPENYTTLCCDCHRYLSEHIKEYNTDKGFNVLRIKSGSKIITHDSLYIYSNGFLRCIVNSSEIDITMTENTTHQIVQFLINNWLING